MFLVIEFIFLSIAACASAGKQSFDSGNYVIEWKTLPETKEIEFKITAKTTGWVGLGISKENKDMEKLDIVVGGYASGMGYLWDMYADGASRPTQDTNKDVTLLSSKEENGMTMLSFKRKLNTGDVKDNEIKETEGYYLAWAYHATIDASNLATFPYHGESKGYSDSAIKLVSPVAPPTDKPTTEAPTKVVTTVMTTASPTDSPESTTEAPTKVATTIMTGAPNEDYSTTEAPTVVTTVRATVAPGNYSSTEAPTSTRKSTSTPTKTPIKPTTAASNFSPTVLVIALAVTAVHVLKNV